MAVHFKIEKASTGRSSCKDTACKQVIDKDSLRVGKLTPSPFDASKDMTAWYHLNCIFNAQKRSRTWKIERADQLDGFEDLSSEDQASVQEAIDAAAKDTKPAAKGKPKQQATLTADGAVAAPAPAPAQKGKPQPVPGMKADVPNAVLLIKLLLPGKDPRVYSVQDKSLARILSKLFGEDIEEMSAAIAISGDVSIACEQFFAYNKLNPPQASSTLSLAEVDGFLDELTTATKDGEQTDIWRRIVSRCTVSDLKWFIRLVKHDLHINAGPNVVLKGVHADAYEAYHRSNNLEAIVTHYATKADTGGGKTTPLKRSHSVGVDVMTAVKPMLAEAVSSFKDAMKKCPNGMFAEIKYDGERVQIHKQGSDFKFFSRNLKPVKDDKIAEVRPFVTKALPSADSVILDSEVLLVDKQGNLLKFGTIGVHKRQAFKDASVCLFVFDILYYNGASCLDMGMEERRKLLCDIVKPIQGHVELSVNKEVTDADVLAALMGHVIDRGLEGMVLKDKKSKYLPGKRKWLKIKRDYLSMADTADLVIVGGYYGTGTKGGKISGFLGAVYDERNKVWKTVCKVSTGLDIPTLDRINRDVKMDRVNSRKDVPSWLSVHNSHIPDFIVPDPWAAPVWEISGAEYSASEHHTANGISIRFPRLTKERSDKTPKEATTLAELEKLYKNSSRVDTTHLNTGAAVPADFEPSMAAIAIAHGGDTAAALKALKTSAHDGTAEDSGVETEPELSGDESPVAATGAGGDDGVTTEPERGDGVDTEPEVDDGVHTEAESEADVKPTPAPKGMPKPATKPVVPAPKPAPAPAATPNKPRCQYWDKCYRKNPDHLRDFLHPADVPATAMPAPKARESCIYGAACYRKNPAHRAEMAHPGDADYEPAASEDEDDLSDNDAGNVVDTRRRNRKKVKYNDEGNDLDGFIVSDSEGGGGSSEFVSDEDEDDVSEYTDSDDGKDVNPKRKAAKRRKVTAAAPAPKATRKPVTSTTSQTAPSKPAASASVDAGGGGDDDDEFFGGVGGGSSQPGGGCGAPVPDDKFARDRQLRDLAVEKLVATGERDRLKQQLREQLIASGWFDDLKQHCKDVIKTKGLEKITVDDLVAEIAPHGRATVPDRIREDILVQIRRFLDSV